MYHVLHFTTENRVDFDSVHTRLVFLKYVFCVMILKVELQMLYYVSVFSYLRNRNRLSREKLVLQILRKSRVNLMIYR